MRNIQFIINKDRSLTFGSYVSPAPRPWECLFSIPPGPSRLFFSKLPSGISYLAFTSLHATLTCGFPQSQAPPSPRSQAPSSPLLCSATEPIFFTTAQLRSVVTITPCRARRATYAPVIGLLFTYADGSRTCVGQFRLDYATPELRVDDLQPMRLAFARREEDNSPYVEEVDLVGSASIRPPGRWFDVPWDGQLEWWFSYNQCVIYHIDVSGKPSQLRLPPLA